MEGKVVKTDDAVNFCGGCNNQVVMSKFIAVDEGEEINKAWERRNENANDEVFKRSRYMGFCSCGNVYLR